MLTGTIAHSGGTTIVGGTLQVGGGGTTGAISGNFLNNATLAFDRSDNLTFAGVVSGAGAVAQSGAGTLELSGSNTYSGGTIINSGKLLVNNIANSGTGSGPVVVNSGATLGGTGAIAGAVTVNAGAHMAPGASLESLDVGSLTLAAGSILDFELDTILDVDSSDLINVTATNGLTINGGTLNLTNAGSMTGGTYALIDYSGTLNGNLGNISFGITPPGFAYSLINNATNTSVDLVVQALGDFNDDGRVDAADYVVWRKGLGTTYTPADYETWRIHFGQAFATGASLSAAVPEPATWSMLGIGIALVLLGGRNGR